MAGKRAGPLLALMERMERFTLNRVWTDLTDDEFWWEPVNGAWGIRRREQCATTTPFGNGEWVVDFGNDPAVAATRGENVEPPTTIGWLLWHIASTPGRLCDVDLFGGDHTMASGWTSAYLTHHPVFTSASAATSALRLGWNQLRSLLEVTDDLGLERRSAVYTYSTEPPRDGVFIAGAPGPAFPAYVFVASVLNELSHHGSQICTLRDLYRWRT